MKSTQKSLSRFTQLFMVAIAMVAFVACSNGDKNKAKDMANDAANTAENAGDAAATVAAEAEKAAKEAADKAKADMEAMASNDADLSFAEGSWGYDVMQYGQSGTGSKTIVLDKIPFEGEDLSAEGAKQLDELASLLTKYPDMMIEIQGHTKKADNAVGRTKKKATSKARALWVQAKLAVRNVSGSQMKSSGKADEMLLEGVDPEADAQQRITIELSKK